MPLNIDSFKSIANSAFITSRDIAVVGEGDNATARLGNYFFSQGKTVNDATMSAFKAALEKEYGVFGTHAFDTVLGARSQTHKSLRAADVKAVLSSLETVKAARYRGELARQLDTNPKFRELSEGMRKLVRSTIASSPLDGSLKDCANDADLASKAVARIERAVVVAKEFVERKKLADPKFDVDQDTHALEGRKETETAAKSGEATGLRRLKLAFRGKETSIEDRIKKGTLGAGMRVNRSNTNPVLLEKVKTNGVEPGFIYRSDWSKDDTHGYMADVNSQASRDALEQLKESDQAFAAKCEGKSVRDQILLAGRAHPAGVAAAAELLIEEAAKLALGGPGLVAAGDGTKPLPDVVKNLAGALKNHFANQADIKLLSQLSVEGKCGKSLLDECKKELFSAIRDAVMNIGPDDVDSSGGNLHARSPIFRHFSDRAIVKLDYNEGDKFSGAAGSAGTFMRPERILNNRKPVLGQIYRFQTRATADNISAGAVTEALANDLTRVAGVPSQELQIVRGQYSDGHPKFMLAAKFANGYKDMEAGMIKDGRVVKPAGAPADLKMESLGKYKAFFLVTADRDGVGSRGQNKGFVDGKFFAIDPGHSLEGNGQYLEIADDLSFKDTYGFSTKPRFNNFSIFDDDTRYAKFSGILDLREKVRAGVFDKVFADYKAAFDPKEMGIPAEEKALREKIIADIGKKETEFKANIAKVLGAGAMQLELHDALEGQPQAVREGAIETLGNLEKLFSATKWVSKKGKVPLQHLENIPNLRLKWSAGVEGGNIVYHTDELIGEMQRSQLESIAKSAGATLTTDAMFVTRLVIPKENAARFFAAFTEDKVAQLTHPEEYAARKSGVGDPLKLAKTFEPSAPPFPAIGKPMTSSQLPDELDLPVDGQVVKLPKIHYEDMATTSSNVRRPCNEGELRAMLGARIARGNEILRALLNGNVSRFEPTVRNAAALTLALHVAALKKGEFMYRGSFSVEDPQGNIARWLDKIPSIYQRTSTHAQPYQKMQVDGHLNMPRGLDVPTGMGGLFNGMRTFHYFSLPDTDHLGDNQGSGPRRRLFLKCETYGIYFSTAHFHPFNKADAKTEGMRTRYYQFGDICESIAHGASLVVSKFTSKTAHGIRKENLPEPVVKAMKDIVDDLGKSGFRQLSNELLSSGVMKDDDAVLEGGGLRMFADNLMAHIRKLPDEDAFRVMDVIDKHLQIINDTLGNINGNDKDRMGNEIMLDAKDFGVDYR